jgi:hypothetical protein
MVPVCSERDSDRQRTSFHRKVRTTAKFKDRTRIFRHGVIEQFREMLFIKKMLFKELSYITKHIDQ